MSAIHPGVPPLTSCEIKDKTGEGIWCITSQGS